MAPLRLASALAVLVGLVPGRLPAQSGQASALTAQYRFGQTFLVWKEAAGTTVPDAYRIYRSNSAITRTADLAGAVLVAEVPKGSYWNRRANRPFVLTDLGTPLSKGQGFLVTTPVTGGTRYYAVLAVTQGKENRVITTGSGGNVAGPVIEIVSTPKPVLQSTAQNGKVLDYVHFATSVDRPGLPAQANTEGRAFNYRIVFDPQTAGPRPVFVLLHAHSQDFRSYPMPSWADKNALFLFLDDDNPPVSHSLWFGYHQQYGKGTPSGKVVDYTERRILWVLDLVLSNPKFQADRNRVYAFGASLGAMGALGLGIRHADRFAAVGGIVPAFGITHSDFSLKSEVTKLFGSPTLNLPSSLGPKIYDLFDYKTVVANLGSKTISPMVFTMGRGDAVTGWSEKPAFMKAVDATHQFGAFYWDYRSHGVPGTWSPLEASLFYEISRIRLDKPLPVLTNLSINDDPGDGNRLKGTGIGTLNGYARFDPATILESSTLLQADVGLKNDPSRRDYAMQAKAYADLTFRRVRTFPLVKGNYYKVTSYAKGGTAILEERFAVLDSKGLLTIPRIELSRNLRTVKVTPAQPKLPLAHIGGSRVIGGSLAVSLLAKGGQPAILTVGTKKGAIQTPFGVWGILDPIIAWAGWTPQSGLVGLFMRIPKDPRLSGLVLLAQGMVGSRFTPLAAYKIL